MIKYGRLSWKHGGLLRLKLRGLPKAVSANIGRESRNKLTDGAW